MGQISVNFVWVSQICRPIEISLIWKSPGSLTYGANLTFLNLLMFISISPVIYDYCWLMTRWWLRWSVLTTHWCHWAARGWSRVVGTYIAPHVCSRSTAVDTDSPHWTLGSLAQWVMLGLGSRNWHTCWHYTLHTLLAPLHYTQAYTQRICTPVTDNLLFLISSNRKHSGSMIHVWK